MSCYVYQIPDFGQELIQLYHIWWFILFKQFKPQEMTDIMKDFDEPGHLAPTGLFLAGLKYMVIQGEPGAVIRGKKVWLWCF